MNWQQVAEMAELDESYPTPRIVGRVPVAIFLLQGAVYATSNLCTHGQAQLSDGYQEGGVIECPLHQGRFDICTGKAMGTPATIDLKVFPTEVRGDTVWIALD